MSNTSKQFRPLDVNSTNGSALQINAAAGGEALFDEGARRLTAVAQLMKTVATQAAENGFPEDTANIAQVAWILTEDGLSLVEEAHTVSKPMEVA